MASNFSSIKHVSAHGSFDADGVCSGDVIKRQTVGKIPKFESLFLVRPVNKTSDLCQFSPERSKQVADKNDLIQEEIYHNLCSLAPNWSRKRTKRALSVNENAAI